MTYFCYTDESGTPEVPGTSSHFVLVGIAIPIQFWRIADHAVGQILAKYDLGEAEIHTAWLLRPYLEQRKIAGFDKMTRDERRAASLRFRAGELLRLRRQKSNKPHNQAKKNYAHTAAYTHLTLEERRQLVADLVSCVAGWEFAVLFAEAIDKLHFDEARAGRTIGEQAFEQLVSRFQQFLVNSPRASGQYGVLVHDNNQTVASKHTELMRDFHDKGTLWSDVDRISETPLFVDSKLTRMVQIADLCSYILRRYVENGEQDYLDVILKRVDRNPYQVAVGMRHYSVRTCDCLICQHHRPLSIARAKRGRRTVESSA